MKIIYSDAVFQEAGNAVELIAQEFGVTLPPGTHEERVKRALAANSGFKHQLMSHGDGEIVYEIDDELVIGFIRTYSKFISYGRMIYEFARPLLEMLQKDLVALSIKADERV